MSCMILYVQLLTKSTPASRYVLINKLFVDSSHYAMQIDLDALG